MKKEIKGLENLVECYEINIKRLNEEIEILNRKNKDTIHEYEILMHEQEDNAVKIKEDLLSKMDEYNFRYNSDRNDLLKKITEKNNEIKILKEEAIDNNKIKKEITSELNTSRKELKEQKINVTE